MRKLLYKLDERVNLVFILFLFWALFWTLNGGDKFFNSTTVPNTEAWAASSVIVENGEIVGAIHPREPLGFYGVNRNAKMIGYFNRLGLPAWVALSCLYGMAGFEIVLGVTFFALFFWSLLPAERQTKPQLFADRTIHRLAFKGSAFVFVIFSTGDILFGDRIELWEHGTFLTMCLLTYFVWFRVDLFLLEERRGQTSSDRSPQTALYGAETKR